MASVLERGITNNYSLGTRGGYLVERWVRGCAAQIAAFSGSQVLQWPLFYLKIGFYIGRIFAKCIISDEFVLWFIYRLSKKYLCIPIYIVKKYRLVLKRALKETNGFDIGSKFASSLVLL